MITGHTQFELDLHNFNNCRQYNLTDFNYCQQYNRTESFNTEDLFHIFGLFRTVLRHIHLRFDDKKQIWQQSLSTLIQ